VSDFWRAKNYPGLSPNWHIEPVTLITTWPYTGTLFQKTRLPSLKHNPPDTLAREKSRN
ncbi:hypothetical protein CDAR_54101, partial [Caerostris darwini]